MKPKTIFLAVWCQLSRIGGQVWWRFPHRFERTQPSKWFCEVQLPKRADRDVSVKCLLPGHSCVSAQCPSWTFRTAQDEHTWGWAGSSSVCRPMWSLDDRGLRIRLWQRGTVAAAFAWAGGHPPDVPWRWGSWGTYDLWAPMGTYGHLWAPMGTYGHLQNGQLRVFEFNMAMDPIQ